MQGAAQHEVFHHLVEKFLREGDGFFAGCVMRHGCKGCDCPHGDRRRKADVNFPENLSAIPDGFGGGAG